MRVQARTRRRKMKIYELALMTGYINCMMGVILALMGTPVALIPLTFGLSTWTFAVNFGRRYDLE